MASTFFEDVSKTAECPVCQHQFISPRILYNCGHTICLSCIQGIVKNNPYPTCPLCRKKIEIPKDGVEGLPLNLLAQNVSESVKTHPQQKYCEEHEYRLTMYCKTCDEAICVQCQVEDDDCKHSGTSLKKHLSQNEDVYVEHTKQLERKLRKLNIQKESQEEDKALYYEKRRVRLLQCKRSFDEFCRQMQQHKEAVEAEIKESDAKIQEIFERNAKRREQATNRTEDYLATAEKTWKSGSETDKLDLLKSIKKGYNYNTPLVEDLEPKWTVPAEISWIDFALLHPRVIAARRQLGSSRSSSYETVDKKWANNLREFLTCHADTCPSTRPERGFGSDSFSLDTKMFELLKKSDLGEARFTYRSGVRRFPKPKEEEQKLTYG